ncbi:hypothetical protein [uncultured Clostridium sp.]|uniref:hypothetical protein n=1 Tax=uncultured Clostridium sp. TaxID=59620 RepID=UPI0025CEC7AA|nr:hypothetical protein [uncultured Clostridium sp.]
MLLFLSSLKSGLAYALNCKIEMAQDILFFIKNDLIENIEDIIDKADAKIVRKDEE